ncbi:MAG: type IX secretion system sortase PorU [Microbacter sp.]
MAFHRVLLWFLLLLFVCVAPFSYGALHAYGSSSVLNQGTWTKIRVSSTGFYKISFDDLKKMGITNPQNVHVYGYGGAELPEDFTKPFIDDLPDNAIYVGSNFIAFYAQGPVSWQYNVAKKRFVHTTNYYSNYGYYFVTQNNTPVKHILSAIADTAAPTDTADCFLDYAVHEKDLENLANSGREFYGEIFSYTHAYTFSFSFPNADQRRNSFISIDAVANASLNSSFTASMNNSEVGTFPISAVSSMYDYARQGSGVFSFTPVSDNLNVNLNYNQPNAVATGYLNWIEMNVYRKLVMNGSIMFFQNPDYLNTSKIPLYVLSKVSSGVVVWNLSDPQNIQSMSVTRQSDQLSFVSSASNKTLQWFVAVDTTQLSNLPSPEVVQNNVPNQNLHALSPQDMVIISPAAFVQQAETLAQFHRDHDGLNVVVVTPEQVYNEFSSGTPDATAYRKLMKMLYDRYGSDPTTAPKYLLLFGRGCFDNRGIVPTSDPIRQLLYFESYNSISQTASYVSDDYFGFLDDQSGVNLNSDNLRIGVGRFPIYTVEQAQETVNKTIQYMQNQNTGYWKNQVCFMGDYFAGDAPTYDIHMMQADSIASLTAAANPNVHINKVYLDAFKAVTNATSVTYPGARDKMLNLIKSGLLMLNYTGHGGTSGWSNSQILTTADIQAMYNQDLALWVTATCDFTRCDYTSLTAGEQVFLNPNGGGIGLFTTTRTVFSNANFTINQNFAKNVFYRDSLGNSLRLGDMMRRTKNAMPGDDNKMNFILIGDPALKLAFPAPNYAVIVDSINHQPISKLDTLKALSGMTVSGHINDPSSNGVCRQFNGYVQTYIFDKKQKITTLANISGSLPFVYYDRPTVLYSGKALVKGGYFTVQTIIPKDINYNFGTGRMNFYAADSLGHEGQGNFENFMVGGTNPQVIWETQGPTIDMYLNSPQFRNGDQVNSTPLFVANVSDQTGINAVGSGIGHDITLIVDNDPNQYYVLNDYYQSALGDFRSGTVQYQLPALSDGKHTLTFRIWDVLNNSSDSTIYFIVQHDLKPSLFSVSNYPNPVVGGSTNFVLQHDRPDNLLSVRIFVYDLSGRLITSMQQNAFTNSSKTIIPWNVTDANGTRLKPGMYLYRFEISTSNGAFSSKTQKVIVSR